MKHATPWRAARDLPNPGIKARSPTLQADSLPSEPPGKPETRAKNGNLGPTRPKPVSHLHVSTSHGTV